MLRSYKKNASIRLDKVKHFLQNKTAVLQKNRRFFIFKKHLPS